MTRREVVIFCAVLVVLGAGWGITQPLTKIAVSTGYGHFGLVFWQLAIGAALMAAICALRGISLPFARRHLRLYLLLAMIGTILPNTASYQAAVHVPSGILSILLSMIPMFAFPIALALGLDRFSLRRLAGLLAGLCGVLLIVAPGVALPGDVAVFWVFVALIAGAFYAVEGNVVAKWGTEGLNPIQVLYGASLVGAVIMAPVAWVSGQWIDPRPPLDPQQWALVGSSVAHVLVYAGYVWLVGRAGPVFAVQVSYFVTGFGILWAKLILGEAYSPFVWAALAMMFAGLYLVQPRPHATLAQGRAIGDTAP
ncbi:DMT family transporter [Sulfitobacter sabulilitoris]|uniref:DMT family transporter n=1 Tax=Sulfitobacter sabulilitoris TaxID=2562655 RepID=A0A5S3PDD4_9RHOB|nr:DMT family transporter [Sulfitobacter sabulilitoris]TMM51879.1 DMT family transporter [Sulfitobacter sabulilitoris]